jgi:hypothetical protein
MASGVGADLPTLRFQGMTESIAPMCSTLLTNLARIYRIPVGSGPGPEARRKETRLPIVATSSGRLFLDRVARQHCPSPLHRHTQFNMHFSQAPAKGDISTLPAGGHFYFALTLSVTRLTPAFAAVILRQFNLAEVVALKRKKVRPL